MKHTAASDEDSHELLINNNNRLQAHASAFETPQMMTNDSLDSKMLMPHELGSDTSLVGQHSIRHGNYDSVWPSGFNGYHSSYHSTFSNSTTTFSNLIHQQMNNNLHHSSSVPPLIHQQTPYNNSKPETDPPLETSESRAGIKEEEVEIQTEEVPAKSEVLGEPTEPDEPEPEIDIVISNVVCAFSVRCHLKLKDIALQGANVEFKRENGMVTMKLRKPYTTASIWSSGKITCTGATSEDMAKVAARRYARVLQKLNFRVRFQNYRVVNVLGTCKMPWGINIVKFSEKYKKEASYEPELHPGVTYNLHNPTATLKVFSTGSMTVTARSVANVQSAIEHIYPLVYEFKKPRQQKEDHNPDEEEEIRRLIDSDSGDDFDEEVVELVDPLDHQPPLKRQRLRDVSHLTKRYKGNWKTSKRPPGKTNDPTEDLITVSDVDDPDDPDDF